MKDKSVFKHRNVLSRISNFNYHFVFDFQMEIVTLDNLKIFLKKAQEKNVKNGLKSKIFKVVCSQIDVYELIKQYSLEKIYDYQAIDECTYSDTHHSFPTDANSYVCCKRSIYGNQCYNLNIFGYLIQMTVSPKSKCFKERLNLISLEKLDLSEIVIFDIETTGLSEFDDDILEIALLDLETNRSFSKLLPLKKRESIPQNISTINHITDDIVKDAKALTQSEVDILIENFKLKNKHLAIWTGVNVFDATFLKIYFIDNHLNGFEYFSFFNVKNYIQVNKLLLSDDYSKDSVAKNLGIKIDKTHSALGDCKIEAEILKRFVSEQRVESIDSTIIRDLANGKLCTKNAAVYYEKMISYCTNKNGLVLSDFDCFPFKRGFEWIDIHHIDEKELDDIASRTYRAQESNDTKTLNSLKKYNKATRLVYATVVEHFLLHYIIEYLRGPGGGPHFLFGYILRAHFNIARFSYEKNIFKNIDKYFADISFEEIVNIYKKIIKKDKITKRIAFQFYKLNNTTKEIDDFIDNLFK